MIEIKCSACDKPLMCYKPSKEKTIKAMATCCYCGDHSFVFDFPQHSIVAGIAKEVIVDFPAIVDGGVPEAIKQCEDVENKTFIENIITERDKWTFKIKKAN